jgi:DoxX-like family
MSSILPWIARLLAAIIMLQTLYFKFSGAEESVYIFSILGMEPWGRIGTGVVELIASVLILYPKTSFIGAGLGVGLMIGAISSHLFKLGISINGDGGQLFIYACIVLVCCLFLLYNHRKDGIILFKKII